MIRFYWEVLEYRLAFIIPLMIFTFSGCAQPKKYDVALVGFYNLENLFDTINQPNVQDDEFTPGSAKRYTSKVYNDKLKKLSRVISEMGSDGSPDGLAILGVAEVENRSVLEDLVKTPKLVSRNYQIVHVDGPDERGIDVGLIYNPSYFEADKIISLHVPAETLDIIKGHTRDILLVSGELMGEKLHVFVNHWPSRWGGEEVSRPYRKLAATVCKHAVDSLMFINTEAKILVLGDFNDDPVDESVSVILNAKEEKDKVRTGDLYNPGIALFKKGEGSLCYKGKWNLFDQIMVSSALLNEEQTGFFFKDAEIFKEDYMITKTGKFQGYPRRSYSRDTYIWGYSDHLPVYIILLREF